MVQGQESYAGAFEFLLDGLDERLETLQAASHTQIDRGAFEAAQTALAQARTAKALRDDLEALAERYSDVVVGTQEREGGDRLPRGLKTPQETYRAPILRALVALGGEAGINEVLARVYAEMKDELNSYDLSSLPQTKTPRWRNTAQWTRNAMREEGLIRGDTKRGVWGISEKGRAWVENQT